MKKHYVVPLVLMGLILIGLLGACQKSVTAEEKKDTITVYFYNSTEQKLFAEEVPVDLEPNAPSDKMIDSVIKALYNGPQSNSTLQVKNTMPIKKVDLKDRIVNITLDVSYNALTAKEQVIIRTTLVYSFVELDFVDAVEFLVEDKPLMNVNGDRIGPISSNNIIMNVLEPNPPTTMQMVNLYFTNEDSTKLVKEQREILVNNSIPLEKYIVEELIKGPNTQGLITTIPKATKINDIITKDGVCQVDLSVDLKSKDFTTPQSKKLMIYAIVNSLTDLPTSQKSRIQKVAFLIEGKKEVEFTSDIDLSEFLERDESLIEEN